MKNQFYDYAKHGITQSVLKTWLSCRKKAELSLEGWSLNRQSSALTYGTIVHATLERIYSLIQREAITKIPSEKLIKSTIKFIESKWKEENSIKSTDRKTLDMLDECCLIAEVTLPAYFKYWWGKEFKKFKWESLEQEFNIPYITKKGDKTFLRGKKDGVYSLKKTSVKLFETKTKSLINLNDLIDTLWFEFQVNLYFWAIKQTYGKYPSGVTYNIIRKPSIQRKANESKVLYAKRLGQDISKRPDFYFLRLEVSVSKEDMSKFEKELDGIVQDFIDWRKGRVPTYKNTSHCIDKYGRCPFVDVCSKGDFSNLEKRKKVFSELEDL